MPNVTVLGAGGSTVTVPFATSSNLALAQQIAASIGAMVAGGANTSQDSVPPLAPGATGEFVGTRTAVTRLTTGYTDVVATGTRAVIFGSGDADERILAGSGGLTFSAAAGSGTLVAGGGNNSVFIRATDSGNWDISTDSGNDAIAVLGTGSSTIAAGTGNNTISLGAGRYSVDATGNDTVLAGSGAETINVSGAGVVDVVKNSGQITFVNGAGASTVDGGTGTSTIFGNAGGGVYTGGTAGANFLQAGAGAATLVANGTAFGNDTVAFTGGGGTDLVRNFVSGLDKVSLLGGVTLQNQNVVGGSLNVTLSDGTKITFANLGHTLNGSDFG